MKAKILLLPWQKEFLEDRHKIKILLAGRQSGKSHALMAGLTKICAGGPGRSAVILPIQAQANEFYKVMISGQGFESLMATEPKLWPYPAMVFHSGHYLEFRSFENPKRLRGGKWTGVVAIDEANDLSGDEVLRVALLKTSSTNAQVWITSTITSHNWLWDKYLQGQANDPMVRSWLKTSEEGYPFRGEEGKKRLADLKTITPKWIWDSEMMCIPGTDNSTAFPYWQQCLTDAAPPDRPLSTRKYIVGLDLGRTADQEVAIVLDDTGGVCEIVEFPSGSAALQHAVMAQRIVSLCRHWNNAPLVIDSTGKGGSGGNLKPQEDSHVEIYRRACDPANITLREFYWSANRDNQTKADVISHLMLLTEQQRIHCPKQFNSLDAQMKAYRILKAKGSASTFGPAPNASVNDDGVASLAQAAWGAFHEDWFEGAQSGGDLSSAFG